jgi:hypothetical protein
MKSYASFQNSILMHMLSKCHMKMRGSLTAYEGRSRVNPNPSKQSEFDSQFLAVKLSLNLNNFHKVMLAMTSKIFNLKVI